MIIVVVEVVHLELVFQLSTIEHAHVKSARANVDSLCARVCVCVCLSLYVCVQSKAKAKQKQSKAKQSEATAIAKQQDVTCNLALLCFALLKAKQS